MTSLFDSDDEIFQNTTIQVISTIIVILSLILIVTLLIAIINQTFHTFPKRQRKRYIITKPPLFLLYFVISANLLTSISVCWWIVKTQILVSLSADYCQLTYADPADSGKYCDEECASYCSDDPYCELYQSKYQSQIDNPEYHSGHLAHYTDRCNDDSSCKCTVAEFIYAISVTFWVLVGIMVSVKIINFGNRELICNFNKIKEKYTNKTLWFAGNLHCICCRNQIAPNLLYLLLCFIWILFCYFYYLNNNYIIMLCEFVSILIVFLLQISVQCYWYFGFNLNLDFVAAGEIMNTINCIFGDDIGFIIRSYLPLSYDIKHCPPVYFISGYSGIIIPEFELFCYGCGRTLIDTEFSNRQKKKGDDLRRCKNCVRDYKIPKPVCTFYWNQCRDEIQPLCERNSIVLTTAPEY